MGRLYGLASPIILSRAAGKGRKSTPAKGKTWPRLDIGRCFAYAAMQHE